MNATETKTKHTPGPWRTMANGPGFTVNYNGPSHNWLVATINETPYIGFHAANADLIAAAPSLLEALQGLFEHCSMIHKHWGEGCNQKEADAAIANARAAIKKAQGL